MARDIEKNISQLVQNQFPSFYKEEGEMFIAFIKAYYEWLETPQFLDEDGDVVQNTSDTLYHSRRLTDYRDIDKTVDAFILDFKNKYLTDIQFNVATNKRLFIKNALEFYRAKGTPRAIDLFFKLVYGIEARVYLPSDDIFRLSDNEWSDERYLEVAPAKTNVNFVGKQVFGEVSQTSAFCEKLIRVKKGTVYTEVLYLTGLSGAFITGETVSAFDDDPASDIKYQNKHIGSLSAFNIVSSDPNFEVGENVYVKTGSGKKGRAVVTAVTTAVGVVNFNFVNGGWGYSNKAQIIGSDRTLKFDNVSFTNEGWFYHNEPFEQFGLLKQDLVRFNLNTSNTTSETDALALPIGTEITITVGDNAGSNVVWEGVLVEKSLPNSTLDVNYVRASYSNTAAGVTLTDDGRDLYGNTEITMIFGDDNGNTVQIDVTNTIPVEISVEGNVIATSNTFTLDYTTTDELAFETGEVFYQKDPEYGHIYSTAEFLESYSESTKNFMTLQATRGYFRTNQPFYRLSGNTAYTLNGMSNVAVGMIGGRSGTELNFRLNANTYTANVQLGTHCAGSSNNKTSTYTSEAAFKISAFDETKSYFNYETTDKNGNPLEISEIGLDTIIDEVANVDSADPGLSPIFYISNGSIIEYGNTTLADALNYTQTAVEIGEIQSIVVSAPGEGYGDDPFFIVYDPLAYHTERYDFYIKYVSEDDEDLNKAYLEGEIIRVTGRDGAKARITKYIQSTREIYATRLSYTSNNELFYTTNDFRNGDTITGEVSGISAIIERVDETRYKPRVGLNADVQSTALSGAGFATDLQILDSGFGYIGKIKDPATNEFVKGEELVLASVNDSSKEISAKGYLGQNGVAPGTHPNRRSFLSSDKYIPDNDFYQEYSYQVLSALPFSKYKKTLIDVLHLAGSKPFGGYVGTSEVSVDITPTDLISTFDIKSFTLFANENTFYEHTVA